MASSFLMCFNNIVIINRESIRHNISKRGFYMKNTKFVFLSLIALTLSACGGKGGNGGSGDKSNGGNVSNDNFTINMPNDVSMMSNTFKKIFRFPQKFSL